MPWAKASAVTLARNCGGMFVRCTSSTRSCSERWLSSRVVAALLAIVPLLLPEPTRRPLLSVGAATPLGEVDPLRLPLTPSCRVDTAEGALEQCPRGVLASKGVTGTYSATGCGALVRSSAASLRGGGRLESSCWARGTSSVRIPVGYEGSAVGRVAEGWEPFALRSDFCATTRNVFSRPPTRSTAARARTIC